MGDTKHIRLAVRFASQKDIQDVIHRDFTPGVHSHKYSKGADRNSVTVEVVGDVDAGKLYERLQKIASSVEIEIESVIPAKMKRFEEDLKSENETTRRKNQRLRSKIKSLKEDKKNLERKIEYLKDDNEREISVTSAAMQGMDNSIIERDREHEIKLLKETIVHLNSKISTLEEKNTISENGRRAKKRELKRLKEQLGQLKM